jgi:hypothetical protein
MNPGDVVQEGVQVVIVGQFNPAIVSGGWLVGNDLISQADADDSEVFPSPGQASFFRVGWLRCDIFQNRMQFGCETPENYELLRDVALGTIGILDESPVSGLGINRHLHYRIEDTELWHRIGDALVPKDPWSDVLRLPGMRDVSLNAIRDDEFGGEINVSIQPSGIVRPGLFAAVNDHYNLRVDEKKPTDRDEFFDPEFMAAAAKLVEPDAEYIPTLKRILGSNWSSSLAKVEDILEAALKAGRK